MTKDFLLSPQASARLVDIAAWTENNFGSHQADKYIDLLIARVMALCAGHIAHASCSEKFAPSLRADLRFVRAEKHFIIFTETPASIRIIDFLHQSADITRHLQGPHP